MSVADDLAKLKAIRARGVRSVDFGDGKGSVTYANDDELAAAIAALEGEIAAGIGTPTVRRISVTLSNERCP